MWREAKEMLINDQYLSEYVIKYSSCKIKKSPKSQYFSDLVESIVNQQLSGKAAATIFSRVRQLLITISPETVSSVTDQGLRDCGLSWNKVSFIKDLANKVISGELNISQLDKCSDEEVIEELIQVKGIGRWTAEMFLMFSLARPDVFPLDDLGIKNGMEKIFNSKMMSKQEMETVSFKWKPYRTIASWYIWRSLEN